MSIGDSLSRLMPTRSRDPNAARLAALETIVGAGLESFVSVGTALAEIRDERLYLATHATFAEYLEQRWSMKIRRAYQLISAAGVVDNVQRVAQITPTEPQARELSKLPATAQPDAWSQAVAAAGPAAPTTADVAAIVETKRPGRRRKKAPKAIRLRLPAGTLIIERRTADIDPAELLRQGLERLAAQKAAA